MARFWKAISERGTVHVEPSQLSIVVFRFVPRRRRRPVFARKCLARKFMGAVGVAAVEAAGSLSFRLERRRLLARTAQAVSDSRRRDLPQQRHRGIESRARAARGV